MDEDRTYPVFAQKCNLKDGGISLEQARFLDPATVNKWSEEYKLRTGDVLVNSTGTGTVGRTRLFNENCIGQYPFVVPDSHVSVIRTFDEICSEFVYAYLSTNIIQEYLADNLAGSTNQKELYIGVLENMPFPLPTYNEQQRIVSEIDKWSCCIENVEQNKTSLSDTLKLAKSKILNLAIHGKLVPQNPSDEPASELLKRINPKAEIACDNPRYGKLPEGWVWATLGEISNYGNNKSVPAENIRDNDWVLELEDIAKDNANIVQILTKKERSIRGVRHSFCKGDILYSKLRTYLNKVLVAPNDGFCTTEIIAFGAYGQISNDYICHVLRSKYFVDYTRQCGFGVKMPRLSTQDARKGIVPIPPLQEQHRIVAKIEELFSQLDMIESSL